MLLLTREVKQRVIICDNIIVEVFEFSVDRATGKTRVRLGFTAPMEVPIHREEVWLEIQKEKSDLQRLADSSHDTAGEVVTISETDHRHQHAARVAELESSVPRRRTFADLKSAGLTPIQMADAAGNEPLDTVSLVLICLETAREIRELQATIICGVDAASAAIAAMDAIGEPETRPNDCHADERRRAENLDQCEFDQGGEYAGGG